MHPQMDCRAYCTATSYRAKQIFEYFRPRYASTVYRDVVHIEVHIPGSSGDAFFFPYGAAVFWGITKEIEVELLQEIRPFEENHFDEIESDEFTYVYGEVSRIKDDEITLPDHQVLTRLAISHAIAQSVKLGTFELAIQKTYNQSKHIPQELAKRGKIPHSKREIRQMMGQLFLERNSINLHVDVLDTPEFFWDYAELEPLYKMMANYLDIKTRVEVLNQRLDIVHELFQMLGTELNHQHSSRLEWTIIWLIIIEVVVSLMRDVFRII